MVASSNADLYSPFQHPMIHEEGPQSSEEGSGLHSPVFGAPYAHGDSFRYHHDSLHPMLPPQYDYSQLEELPNSSSARQSFYSMPSRNHHLQMDFPVSPPVNPRISRGDTSYPIDFRYPPSSSTERRLPGGPSHDSPYNRPSGNSTSLSIEPSLPETSPATAPETTSSATAPREPRKEISSVVIACRQCRSRKIRCDSTRPQCNNCLRRSNECEYDLVPKRRGPDKHPGTRQRTCKKRSADGSAPTSSSNPKRRRTSGPAASGSNVSAPAAPASTSSSANIANDRPVGHHQHQHHQHQQRDLPPQHHSHSHPHSQQQQQHLSLPLPLPPLPLPSRGVVKENMRDHPERPSPPSSSRHQQDRHTQDPYYLHQHQQATPSPTDLRLSADPNVRYKQHQAQVQQQVQDLPAPYRRPPIMYDQGSYTKSSYPHQLDINTFHFPETIHRKFPVPTSPTIETNQKIWWSRILGRVSEGEIISELTFLVQNTGHLLSFINLNFVIKCLMRDETRLRIQPSFILSVLAMAKLMKSSTVELGAAGLQESLALIEDAHRAFREAIDYNWVDATLAEAALILALYESSAHPRHCSSRATTALINLDKLISRIDLTTIDIDMPSSSSPHAPPSDVSRFPPGRVPMIWADYEPDRKCGCFPPEALDPAHQYTNRPYSLPWDENWSVEQIRDEEVRRLCWSALTLVSEYIARCEALKEESPSFFLADPSNYGIFFPGEVLDRSSVPYRSPSDSLSPKESVWALYCRSMLLWNFCNRFLQPSQEEERAEQAQEAFEEAQALEDAVNAHRCNLDTALIYTTKEYIYNTRLLVAQACRSFHGLEDPKTKPGPIFKRKQAEEWLFYQEQVVRQANILIHQLDSPQGVQLTRKPGRVNWFVNQLAICLSLWTHDPTLDDALKLAKNIMYPVDVLNTLFPCPDVQQRTDSFRHQLIQACRSRGIETPLSSAYTVPAFIRA